MQHHDGSQPLSYKKPFKMAVLSYQIFLKAAPAGAEYKLNLVSSVALKTRGSNPWDPTDCVLFFRRASEIKEPQYDALNKRLAIDFAIEETAAVTQLLQSGTSLWLELKVQDERVYVDLFQQHAHVVQRGE